MTIARAPGILYWRWVVANSLGEMLGLGLTFSAGLLILTRLGNQQTTIAILVAFFVAVASGAIEATVVGLAQWWAMNAWFPTIKLAAWWLATLIGALVAYILGYLPSTLMSMGGPAAASQPTPAEPAQWIILLLAAGLGLVGGAVLSFAQWLVLRRAVPGSSIWILANMLAWMAGMPIVFWGIDVSQRLGSMPAVVLFMAAVLLLTGAVVGAIHGIFLVRLAKST